MNWIWVAIGGAIGTSLRYAVSVVSKSLWPGSTRLVFPWATLIINIVGSYLIGRVMAHHQAGTLTEGQRLLLTTGVLGGFTTFSAFSLESITMLGQHRLSAAILYVLLSISLGLLACYVGQQS